MTKAIIDFTMMAFAERKIIYLFLEFLTKYLTATFY
jgi:hypothetical protein